MRSSAEKRRVGRPRASRRRPVLAARVPEEFLAQVQASARASGRNASEELIWRAKQGYLLEREVTVPDTIPVDPARATLTGGEVTVANLDARSRALLQEMLDLAAERAIEKMRERGQS